MLPPTVDFSYRSMRENIIVASDVGGKPKACVVRRRLDEQFKILNAKTHKEGESRFSPARVRRRLDEQ
jgi:hypothetical protein